MVLWWQCWKAPIQWWTELWSRLEIWDWSLVEILKLNFAQIFRLSLVKILILSFGHDFEADVSARFWSWSLFMILTRNTTYKQSLWWKHSTLSSVSPLAMFWILKTLCVWEELEGSLQTLFLGDVESLTYIFPFLNFQNFWRVCEELVGRLLRPDWSFDKRPATCL